MLKGVTFTDRIEVPTQREITDAGQMIVPCAFARTGAQMYSAQQLGMRDRKPDDVVPVFRDEADVFDTASMATFRSAPVTIGHPMKDGLPVAVTADNSKNLQVGFLEGMPVRDEDLLTGTIIITSQDAIDIVEEGTQELSAGYTCDLVTVDEEGESKIYQRNIRANHIAIVPKGRAGSSCRLADEDSSEALTKDSDMSKKEKVDEVVVEDKTLETNIKNEELKVEKPEDKILTTDMEEQLARIPDLESIAEAVQGSGLFGDEALTSDLILQVFDQAVELRVDIIEKAKALSDFSEFNGKTVDEIKAMVVADKMPELDLKDRDEAYINARFEILCEDAERDSPMSKVLKADLVKVDEKPVDLVKEARLRSIERTKA
jgi:hypothetical protein